MAQVLDCLIPQATEEVEIIVSDNASHDDTAEVVHSRQSLFPRLTYYRQPENRGPDRNYLQTIALAQGEFCWLLGDDDLLEDDGISYLLANYLHAVPSPDFLLVTSTVYDRTMTQALCLSAPQIGVVEDIHTNDLFWFFERFFCESGLSAFVVKRSLWNQVDPEKYVGTGLVYLGVTYESLESDALLQVVAKPVVKYRSDNASWSSNTLEIIIANMNRVMNALPERYNPAKPAAMARYRQRVPVTMRLLVSLRADGNYNHRLYIKYVADYFQHRPFARLMAALIAILPTALLWKLKAVMSKQSTK